MFSLLDYLGSTIHKDQKTKIANAFGEVAKCQVLSVGSDHLALSGTADILLPWRYKGPFTVTMRTLAGGKAQVKLDLEGASIEGKDATWDVERYWVNVRFKVETGVIPIPVVLQAARNQTATDLWLNTVSKYWMVPAVLAEEELASAAAYDPRLAPAAMPEAAPSPA